MAEKDLGLIQAIRSGTTPPANTKMIWYNTNDHLHYYYDMVHHLWEKLVSGLVRLQIEITYDDLVSKVNSSELVAGAIYIITDYRTVYDSYSVNRDTVTAIVEPLGVIAITSDKVTSQAFSLLHPEDEIIWDIQADLTSHHNINRTGFIIHRKDTKTNKSADFDFRVILNRRYALSVDSWVSGLDYVVKQWVEYNGYIYVCVSNVHNSMPTPDIDPRFKSTGLSNGDYVATRDVNDLVGFSDNGNYVDFNDYRDFSTFCDTDDFIGIDKNQRDVHVGLDKDGNLPNVILCRNIYKTPTEFSGVNIIGSRGITIFTMEATNVSIVSSEYWLIDNFTGLDSVSNLSASNCKRLKTGGLFHTKVSAMVDSMHGYLYNCDLFDCRNSVSGFMKDVSIGKIRNAYILDIEDMVASELDGVLSANMSRITARKMSGMWAGGDIADITFNVDFDGIPTAGSSVFFDTSFSKRIEKNSDGDYIIIHYDTYGEVIDNI